MCDFPKNVNGCQCFEEACYVSDQDLWPNLTWRSRHQSFSKRRNRSTRLHGAIFVSFHIATL